MRKPREKFDPQICASFVLSWRSENPVLLTPADSFFRFRDIALHHFCYGAGIAHSSSSIEVSDEAHIWSILTIKEDDIFISHWHSLKQLIYCWYRILSGAKFKEIMFDFFVKFVLDDIRTQTKENCPWLFKANCLKTRFLQFSYILSNVSSDCHIITWQIYWAEQIL